jgi:N-methylhydantoinase B
MVGALSQVVPDKVAGDLCRTSFHNLLGGFDTRSGREWVHYEWSSGGNGAFLEDDGPSAMATIDWGDLVTVQSTEVIESRLPILVETSRLATDSGGAGTTRGGLSMQRQMRVLAPEATYSLLSDGAIVPAFGVLGGRAGQPVGAWVERDGVISSFNTPGKIAGHPVSQGGAIIIRSAGGGGYGDPLKRDTARVATDLREGLISEQSAKETYGLVLDDRGEVDSAATAVTRSKIASARISLRAISNGSDAFEVGLWSQRRVFRLSAADAARLGIAENDLVEIDARKAAPLRGWVRVETQATSGAIPLDQRALEILKVSIGDAIEVRLISGIQDRPQQSSAISTPDSVPSGESSAASRTRDSLGDAVASHKVEAVR